ncbi:hypothetical protein [Desulfofundulus sp.]|uniref:hypothetical protein n=1 Tax=Desulfofundulus sp. TaxID=2282750 RepID=UPI003C73793E
MNTRKLEARLTVSEELRKRFEEAEKNLERIEQKIKPYVKEKPLILKSSFDKWEDASSISLHL